MLSVGLNKAATSWILVNSYYYKQLKICISVYFCINISLILNNFYNSALSGKQLSLYVISVELNNAATLQILVNTAIIPFFKQLQFTYFVLIKFNFEYFYNTTLLDKKVSLFNLLYQIWPENQSAYLPGVRAPWRILRQPTP